MTYNIAISNELKKILDQLRAMYECSYTDAIWKLADQQDDIRAYISSKMSEIRDVVNSKYEKDPEIYDILMTMLRQEALLKKTISERMVIPKGLQLEVDE